jgi:hypothetical protein
MPRSAVILVANADGLCPIVQVRGGQLRRGGSTAHGNDEAVYSIILELGEPICQGCSC